MKVYRVKDGVIIQDGTSAYSIETDWDELINREDLASYLRHLVDTGLPLVASDFGGQILPPIVSQEVWAAGVTYYRSRTARIEESQTVKGSSARPPWPLPVSRQTSCERWLRVWRDL